MTDQTYSWTFTSPAIQIAKHRNPSAVVASESFAMSIGKLLMLWSTYDSESIKLFCCAVRFTGSIIKRPDRLKYHERDAEMVKIVEGFQSAHPEVYQQLSSMLNVARPIQTRRNVIAHGDLEWTGKLVGAEMLPAMIAKGTVAGNPVQHEYTEDELDTLTHDCAHAAGLCQSLNKAATDGWLSGVMSEPERNFLASINRA